MQNDMRDRLVELITEYHETWKHGEGDWKNGIADHLIANGVILPSCQIGDKVFCYTEWGENIYCENINKIFTETSENGDTEFRFETETLGFADADIGKDVFLTKEQAEQKLKELREND